MFWLKRSSISARRWSVHAFWVVLGGRFAYVLAPFWPFLPLWGMISARPLPPFPAILMWWKGVNIRCKKMMFSSDGRAWTKSYDKKLAKTPLKFFLKKSKKIFLKTRRVRGFADPREKFSKIFLDPRSGGWRNGLWNRTVAPSRFTFKSSLAEISSTTCAIIAPASC